MPQLAGFNDQPDELVLQVAGYLCDPHSLVRKHSQPASSRYNDLRQFCLVNRKCRNIGQEVLFTHCDLTSWPAAQPLLLTRSLLENSKLAVVVRSIKIVFDPGCSVFMTTQKQEVFWRFPFHSGDLESRVKWHIHTLISCHIYKTIIDHSTKKKCVPAHCDSELVWTSLWVLLTLTKGLKHLTCVSIIQPASYHRNPCNDVICMRKCFPCIGSLVTLAENSAFQQLESLTLKFVNLHPGAEGFGFILLHSWLLMLPKSISLHLSRDLYGPTVRTATPKYPMPAHQEVFSNVRELVVRNTCFGLLEAIFLRCKSLQTLKYAPSSWTSNNARSFQELLPLVSGSLQKLKVKMEHRTEPETWLSNLNGFSKLRDLEVSGEWSSIGTEPLEFSLPPNIEHLCLQSSYLDFYRPSNEPHPYESLYQVFEEFLCHALSYYPNLKEVVVGGRLPWTFNEEALKKMQGGVVYLVSKHEWKTACGLREKSAREEGKRVFALMKWDEQGNTL